jgi:hypothetical protein
MTADLRLQVIRRAVGELVAFEGGLASTLERARQVRPGQPDVLPAIERFRSMVQTHRDQLATYLKDLGDREPSREAMTFEPTPRAADGLSQVLRGLCLAFSHCVFSYAMLYEMALRLYEPRLREIAPKHLKAFADAAQSTTRLLPAVVAWELAQDGFHCSCICPMCGLGACGCVAFGIQTLIAAQRDAGAAESTPPGFVLQPPKPESELAGAGCKAENCSSPWMVNRCGPSRTFKLRSASTCSGTRCVSWCSGLRNPLASSTCGMSAITRRRERAVPRKPSWLTSLSS